MGQQIKQIAWPHGCIKCFEINKGYLMTTNGLKVCKECGGTVLDTQEAFDHIAELNSEIELYKNDF